MNLFKNKKIIFFSFPLIFVLGLTYLIKKELPLVVEGVLKIVTGVSISSESIEFPRYGEIIITDVKLEDGNKEIVLAPKVIIKYSKESLKARKILEIKVENPEILIERNGDSVNIVDAFAGDTEDEDKNVTETSDEKSGGTVPIELISVVDAKLKFRDISYKKEIEVDLEPVNGYVKFDSEKGIDLDFVGIRDSERYQYKFNNAEKEYSMDINLENIDVKSELIQYGFEDDDIGKATGTFNMNLNISPDGLLGKADLSDGSLEYKQLENNIEKLRGQIDFLGNEIDIKFNGELEEKDVALLVNYKDDEGANVNINLDNISYTQLENYKLLKDLDLPLDDLFFEKININLTNPKEGFLVLLNYEIRDVEKFGIDLKNLKGQGAYQNNILTLKGKDIEIDYPNLGIEKDLTYEFKLNFENESLRIGVVSNYLVGEGIDLKNNKKFIFKQGDNIALIYNYEDKILEHIDIKTKDIFKGYALVIKGAQTEKTFNLKSFAIEDFKENKFVDIFGDINLEDYSYKLKIKSNQFKEENILPQIGTVGILSLDGLLEGKKEKFLFQGVSKDMSVKTDDISVSYYGEITVLNDGELSAGLNGELREVGYKNFKISGIKTNIVYEKNDIKIKELRNGYLNLSGYLNPTSKETNIEIKIRNYSDNILDDRKEKLVINKASGLFKGDFTNINGAVVIDEAYIELGNSEKIDINGILNLSENKLKGENLKISTSLLNLEYNLNDSEGNFTVNILEESLGKYYDYKKIKYRTLGIANGQIKNENISIDLALKLDEVYFQTQKLPNIEVSGKYEKNELENLLNLNAIEFQNDRSENIIKSEGYVDLEKGELNFKIDDQKIDFKSLDEIISTNLIGDFRLNGALEGPFSDIKYFARVSNGKLEISNFEFSNIIIDVEGDTKKFALNDLEIRYEKNLIKGEGEYLITDEKYSFGVFSEGIDLSFLNLTLNQFGVEEVKGIGELNIKLSSDDKNNVGYLRLSDFGVNIPEAYIRVENLNTDINVSRDNILLKEITGNINNGTVKGTGKLTIPQVAELGDFSRLSDEISYKLNLNLDNINYEIDDFFQMNLSSDIVVENEKVTGNLIINDGKITQVMKENKGLLSIIVSKLLSETRNLVSRTKELGSEFEINNQITSTPLFNVNLMIRDGIKIDIDDVSNIAQDIKGTIQGQMTLAGKDDELALIGDVEVQGGRFTLGEEDFTIPRAILLSNARNGYLSNFNPNILVEIKSSDLIDRIEMSLTGEVRNLNLNIVTDTGRESSSLKDIFLGESGSEESKDLLATLFKIIIDTQLTSAVLKPITKTIKEIFNISKLRIVSDIFNQEVLTESDGEGQDSTNLLGFGAYLEAEDPIYKDILYWVARIGIVDGNRSEDEASVTGRGLNDTVNEIDFKVERRYESGWSYGVGVGKLNENNVYRERNEGNLNYYVDFKFEKKYNDIKDIFYER